MMTIRTAPQNKMTDKKNKIHHNNHTSYNEDTYTIKSELTVYIASNMILKISVTIMPISIIFL